MTNKKQRAERERKESKYEKSAAVLQILGQKMVTRPNVSAQPQGK